PWHEAHRASYTARPSARSIGRAGRSSAAASPNAATKRACSAASRAGGTVSRTPAAIESSSALIAGASDVPRRITVARASARKSTVSAYSSGATRRPCASTPFAYSSTATATMLPSRCAGLSCAVARTAQDATATTRRQTEQRRNRIYEGIYRLYRDDTTARLDAPSMRRVRDSRESLGALEHHHCPRCHLAVRQRQPHARHRQLGAPDLSRAVEQQRRRTGVDRHHFHFPPPNSSRTG